MTIQRPHAPRRSRFARLLSGALATTLVASGLTFAGLTILPTTSAQAVPGQPGVTSPGTVVYEEDFQNVATPTPVQRLTAYTGATGQTYTAAPSWLTSCNGWISGMQQPNNAATPIADCGNQLSWNNVQQLAYALGINQGDTPAQAQTNYAVSAYTNNNPGAGLVEFQTSANVPFAGTNRFITFSVDVAAMNCAIALAPRLQFQLVDSSGNAQNAGGVINGCNTSNTVTAPVFGVSPAQTIRVATYTSNGAVLFNGTSVGVRMLNNEGSGAGNDHAFDNIRILDVTPQLDKSFSPALVTTGGNSTLTFTVTNTSELAAKNGWSFTDALPAGLVVADPTAATTTCSSGQITAAAGSTSIAVTGNLNAGQASCTISVNVTSSTPGTFTNGPGNITSSGLNPPAETTVTFQAPALSIEKTAGTPVDVNGNGITDAGDTIPYTFLVTNTGDVDLTDIVVNDPKIADVICPVDALAVGEDTTCEATYTITAADQTSGSVDNVATATGTPPVGDPVTSAPDDTTTPVVAPAPALELVKTADVTEVTTPGQTVTYEFEVTNTGNVPVSGISITDTDFGGSGELSDIICPAGVLAVDAVVTCEATYVVTAEDIDAGGFANTATANGSSVGTNTPVVSNESTEEVEAIQSPEITVVKSVDPSDPDVYEVGQQVTYSFVVTNTGNVTLTDIVINEGEFSGTGDLSDVICPADAASLAPEGTFTCTATYTLTQADVDAGTVTNTATATGDDPNGDPVTSDPSDAELPVVADPSISIVKTATPDTVAAAGETVTYSFLLTNTGNVTLTDAEVVESEFSGTGELGDVICPAEASSLLPGASVTCEATYVLTQADVNAGEVTNTATGTATPPTGDPVVSDPDDAVVTAAPAPGITVVKTATPDTANAAGDVIQYSFLVTNTGNVTLDGIVINEGEFSGTGELSEIVCPVTELDPTETVTCTASYTLTQADVDAGSLSNSATATGTPPSGDPVESDPSEEDVTIPPAGELSIVKSSDTQEITAAGQTVTYSFAVENTGNVTVTDVVVNEVSFSGTGELSEIVCETTTVAPGDVITCSATYVVTQADVDAGALTNAATAGGDDPSGTPVEETPPSDVEIPVTQNPGISIVKSGEITGDEFVAGAEVVYSFVATNTGNVTLTDIVINEVTFSGTGELSEIVCPAEEAASLAPGDQVICEATYLLTQADIDAGEVTNSATATGTPPGDSEPITSEPDDFQFPTPQDASLSIVKTSDAESISEVGQVVTFSFLITNTGNVSISDPEVVEGEFSGTGELSAIDCPAETVLVPGEQVTCEATYTVTQADLDSGALTNTATAIGDDPSGEPIDPSDPSTVEVPTDAQPSLALVKTADKSNVTGVGQLITYTFTITNTGNVTIIDAKVVETQFSGSGELSAIVCEPGAAALAPGAEVDCTATYRTTQADVNAGKVTNTAVASGESVTGGDPVVSGAASASVTVAAGPSLAVTGGEIATGVIVVALLLLVGGGVLLLIRRRGEMISED